MIGVDSGHDWPLEPKFKENGGKIRNALRKRWIDNKKWEVNNKVIFLSNKFNDYMILIRTIN